MASKLYHGTSGRYIDKILRSGFILPRGDKHGNFADVPSAQDFVYLTNMYPFFYAETARRQRYDRYVILEIDEGEISPEALYPDEDCLSYVINRKDGVETKPTDCIGLITMNHKLWSLSLSYFGTVAHLGAVSTKCVSRYLEVRPKLMSPHGRLYFYGLSDVCIVPTALGYRREKMQGEIAWLFGDRETSPSIDERRLVVKKRDRRLFEEAIDDLTHDIKTYTRVVGMKARRSR